MPAPEFHRSVASLAPGAGGRGKVISRSDGYSIVKDHLSKSPYDGLFVLCFVLPKKCPLTIRTKNGQKVRFFKKIIANYSILFICPHLYTDFRRFRHPFFRAPYFLPSPIYSFHKFLGGVLSLSGGIFTNCLQLTPLTY